MPRAGFHLQKRKKWGLVIGHTCVFLTPSAYCWLLVSFSVNIWSSQRAADRLSSLFPLVSASLLSGWLLPTQIWYCLKLLISQYCRCIADIDRIDIDIVSLSCSTHHLFSSHPLGSPLSRVCSKALSRHRYRNLAMVRAISPWLAQSRHSCRNPAKGYVLRTAPALGFSS